MLHSTLSSIVPSSSSCEGPLRSGPIPSFITLDQVAFYLPTKFNSFQAIGRGSFGTVISAYDTDYQRWVAIKKIRQIFRDTLSMKRILREINILKSFKHTNIVTIHEILTGYESNGIIDASNKIQPLISPVDDMKRSDPVSANAQAPTTNTNAKLEHNQSMPANTTVPPLPIFVHHDDINVIYVVMEYVPHDLSDLITSQQRCFSDSEIRWMMYQILTAVTYLHSLDILHRDIKPSNILVDDELNVKLCDFGLARIDPVAFRLGHDGSDEADLESSPIACEMTEQVVSRYYRAPEVMLTSGAYDLGIDLWSCGTLLAEILGRTVLFPGKSPHHQLTLIMEVVGRPTMEEVEQFPGITPSAKEYLTGIVHNRSTTNFDAFTQLQLLYPFAHRDAIDLLYRLLKFSPFHRLKAYEALQHPYLASQFRVTDLPDKLKEEWRQLEAHPHPAPPRPLHIDKKPHFERASSLHTRHRSVLVGSPDQRDPSRPRNGSNGSSMATGVGASHTAGSGSGSGSSIHLGIATSNSSSNQPSELHYIPLTYHRIPCQCAHCSHCVTRQTLFTRLRHLEVQYARIEQEERNTVLTVNTDANPTSFQSSSSSSPPPTDSAGYTLLRDALYSQLNEYARPSTARLLEQHQAEMLALGLVKRSAAVRMMNRREANRNGMHLGDSISPTPSPSPSASSSSTSASEPSSPTLLSPILTATASSSDSTPIISSPMSKPLSLERSGSKRTTLLGIGKSANQMNASSSAHTIPPSSRLDFRSPTRLIGQHPSQPHHLSSSSHPNHHRSASLPMWSDMPIGGVMNGIVTSSIQDPTNVTAAVPHNLSKRKDSFGLVTPPLSRTSSILSDGGANAAPTPPAEMANFTSPTPSIRLNPLRASIGRTPPLPPPSSASSTSSPCIPSPAVGTDGIFATAFSSPVSVPSSSSNRASPSLASASPSSVYLVSPSSGSSHRPPMSHHISSPLNPALLPTPNVANVSMVSPPSSGRSLSSTSSRRANRLSGQGITSGANVNLPHPPTSTSTSTSTSTASSPTMPTVSVPSPPTSMAINHTRLPNIDRAATSMLGSADDSIPAPTSQRGSKSRRQTGTLQPLALASSPATASSADYPIPIDDISSSSTSNPPLVSTSRQRRATFRLDACEPPLSGGGEFPSSSPMLSHAMSLPLNNGHHSTSTSTPAGVGSVSMPNSASSVMSSQQPPTFQRMSSFTLRREAKSSSPSMIALPSSSLPDVSLPLSNRRSTLTRDNSLSISSESSFTSVIPASNPSIPSRRAHRINRQILESNSTNGMNQPLAPTNITATTTPRVDMALSIQSIKR